MALWTPAEISGAVWVDANEATLDGSAVTTLTDKVGGTITATQGTSSARPTLVGDVLNGEPVIQFDGGDYLSFGTTLGKPANWSIFVVGMFDSLPTGSNACMCGSIDSGGGNANAWGRCLAYNGQSWYAFGNGSVSSSGYYASAFSDDTWFMEAQTYTSGADYVKQFLNGVEKTPTKSSTSATACSGTAYEYAIGRQGAVGQYAPSGSRLKGWVQVPSVISADDRQKLEGYYAHLCGLTSLLPSDHPYKTDAPEIAEGATIDGEIEFPAIQVAGGMATECDITLPSLQIYGDFAMEGGISIPLLTISGTTQDFMYGEVRLHGLQIDGEIGVSSRIDSDITLPLLAISGDMQADGEIRLHLLSISGFMQQQGVVSGEITMPRLGVSGSMTVTTWMTGDIAIPAMTISGTMEAVAADFSGDIYLPLLTVMGDMSPASSNDFGTETDRVLRYASSRRRI